MHCVSVRRRPGAHLGTLAVRHLERLPDGVHLNALALGSNSCSLQLQLLCCRSRQGFGLALLRLLQLLCLLLQLLHQHSGQQHNDL